MCPKYLQLYICTHWPTCQIFVCHQISLWHSHGGCGYWCWHGYWAATGNTELSSSCPHPFTVIALRFPKALGQNQREEEFPLFPIPRKVKYPPSFPLSQHQYQEKQPFYLGKIFTPLTRERFYSLGPKKAIANQFNLGPQSDSFFLIQDFWSDRCPKSVNRSS